MFPYHRPMQLYKPIYTPPPTPVFKPTPTPNPSLMPIQQPIRIPQKPIIVAPKTNPPPTPIAPTVTPQPPIRPIHPAASIIKLAGMKAAVQQHQNQNKEPISLTSPFIEQMKEFSIKPSIVATQRMTNIKPPPTLSPSAMATMAESLKLKKKKEEPHLQHLHPPHFDTHYSHTETAQASRDGKDYAHDNKERKEERKNQPNVNDFQEGKELVLNDHEQKPTESKIALTRLVHETVKEEANGCGKFVTTQSQEESVNIILSQIGFQQLQQTENIKSCIKAAIRPDPQASWIRCNPLWTMQYCIDPELLRSQLLQHFPRQPIQNRPNL